MATYLFQIDLPEITEELILQVPLHREHINRLFAEGKILSYSVSINRDYIWCVIVAEEEVEAMHIVATFPMQGFFKDVRCIPLFFHQSIPVAPLAEISLN